MSGENDFSKENFLKKIQEGDSTLLIVGAILMVIPLIVLLLLTSGKSDNKGANQRLKNLTQRKNVFNFATKDDKEGPKAAPSTLSRSSNWFGAKTEEQQISDELHEAMKVVEQSLKEVKAPSFLQGDAKKQYEAEHNFFLCQANGALEERRYADAEKFVEQAIEDARGNVFLIAYAYGTLCAIYEETGDKKKLEEAYKKYFAAVKNIPEEYGGGDLESHARNAYMALKSLNQIDMSKAAEEIANNPLVRAGVVPSNVNIKDVYKDLPVKFE
jgi:tetratricopeptide (TPR) repeat protein